MSNHEKLLVSNCHELHGKKFFLTVLYVNGQRVNEYLQAEEDITSLNERYREYITESGYECGKVIDVTTSTEYIYVSTLGDSGLLGHIASAEETSETYRLFETKMVRDTLIDLYNLVDPATLPKEIKEPNRVEKILIAVLLKIASGLNSLSMRLQTKLGGRKI
ncbi:hypothetical protein [Bacillus thuringiensis]|uniref:PPM-type phosphatase domain-containing protein n=1 Tax=Bacillus thuringiensis serovar toumanoffi TaxID=180862 RepID=A0ABD5I7Y4_BACTU|nr:hypothetical protein [Bacillus thuringiensis]EEM93463.1 hypothetical protein bthur0013_51030 [Bacillus thuringiensis IBL 200]MCR6783153.1 hypothetical protein [Bacillus thuringiensis]MCR6861226.1 hypothetical protein [Bacillus thuringiensis]MCR6863554.1 hypothetical protein [Bacillus thuringiensis]MDW9213285.1 hypothetical protein [Bacillus thuringiensis serovar toumanoffi]